MMNRRDFILGNSAILASVGFRASSSEIRNTVMTVRGPIPADRMGITLSHEHLMCDFTGAENTDPSRYDEEALVEDILPCLKRIRELGCQSFIDCTPAYLGRNVQLLKRLSEESGLHILTNTGYYAAMNEKFIPKHAYDDTPERLAAYWIEEWKEGIDGMAIRPGFIKIGVNAGPLSPISEKLVRAAALTSQATGLTVATHTGDSQSGEEALKIAKESGVPLHSYIWVHAQKGWDIKTRVEAAHQGAWISIDKLAPDNVGEYVGMVSAMKQENVLDRVLLSHDSIRYAFGEQTYKYYHSYETLFTEFIPALRKEGFSEEEILQPIVTNPRNAFALRV